MSWDYIIVGAGAAGAVMANRLSADPAKRVLLLEAGPPDRNILIHVPLGLAGLAHMKGINWNYSTEPQKALEGRRLYWPRGKTLGGSTSVNAMVYTRGHADDYAEWEAAAGPGWSAARMEALLRETEGNARGASADHGGDGPLRVSDLATPNPLSRMFVEAAAGLGFARNDDLGATGAEGVGLYQVMQKRGRRFSTARAFLRPALGRENLTLRTGAQVRRVLFDGTRAIGVELGTGPEWLAPDGEVILSGGAVNSPQLLLLSGIGPADELARHGIALVHESPQVGENLADHLDITVMARTRGKAAIGIAPEIIPRMIRAARHLRHGRGEMTSNVAEAGGFVRSDPDQPRPNLQFHFLPALLRDHGRRLVAGYGMTLHVCDLRPKSRGRIGLQSADPMAPARIEPNYLDHPDDLATLLAGLRIARRVLASAAFAPQGPREVSPGPGAEDDAALIAHIRAGAETIYHPVGTCRMGRDPASVVDPEGRVRGTLGLRVVDASVMPSLPAGNTTAPTVALAENIARMMLGQWES